MSYYQQNQGHRKLLGGFILLSLLAHGLLLMLPDRTLQNNHRLEFSSPIQVTVISSRVMDSPTGSETDAWRMDGNQQATATTVQAPEQPKHEAIAGRPGVDTGRRNVELAKSKPAAARETPAAAVEESIEEMAKDKTLVSASPGHREAPAPAAETGRQENLSLNHLLNQLKTLIKARFTYPRIARRMGWEGLVALSLHIEDDGSLHNVSIARSSGHKVLDENARSTVERIGRLQVASSLALQAVDTEVEVLYRLTD